MSTPPPPRIRGATPEDAPEIATVHAAARRALFQGHLPPRLLDRPPRDVLLTLWQGWLTSPAFHTLVAPRPADADPAPALAAFCTWAPASEADLASPKGAELRTLYVHPDLWNLGLGSALLERAMTQAAAAGHRRMILWTLAVNRRARRFYEARGFLADGAHKVERLEDSDPLLALRYRAPLV